MVLCSSYRNPALVAKMAATLDVISGGRLELGLGAGWFRSEYEEQGFRFSRLGIRVQQLREAATIIDLMWSAGQPFYQGKYFRINGAICYPKPVQKPRPPIWIGGGGIGAMRVAAELADGWDYGDCDAEKFGIRMKRLDSYVPKSHSLRRDMSFSWHGACYPSYDESKIKKNLLRFKPDKLGVREYLEGCIAGPPDLCVEKIRRLAEIGVDQVLLFFPCLQRDDSFELFCDKILPQFL